MIQFPLQSQGCLKPPDIFETYFSDCNYRILDLGCGACCNSTKLEAMGHSVTSLDVVDKSKCKQPQIYDGKTIPYRDNSFDIVLCSFVLHHAPNWIDLLKEMKRVGKYVIIIENTPKNSLDHWFVKLHSKSDWGNCSHCFKTNEEWLDIFENLGFDIKKIKNISRWYFPFADKPLFYPVPSTAYILKSC